jgi:hypothetical protein
MVQIEGQFGYLSSNLKGIIKFSKYSLQIFKIILVHCLKIGYMHLCVGNVLVFSKILQYYHQSHSNVWAMY